MLGTLELNFKREFSLNVKSSYYNIKAFTETWLNNDFTDSKIGFENFNIFTPESLCVLQSMLPYVT